jgi:hypothetical protein
LSGSTVPRPDLRTYIVVGLNVVGTHETMDAVAVLRRISSVAESCGQNILQAYDLTRVIANLNTCKRNLQRIAAVIPANIYNCIEESVESLLKIAVDKTGAIGLPAQSSQSVQRNVLIYGTHVCL